MDVLSLNSIKAWLNKRRLRYVQHEDQELVLLMRSDPASSPVRVVEHPERSMLTWAVALPLQVPESRHAAVCQALNLLNSASFMGAWVLNTRQSEVYFRITVGTLGTQWSDRGTDYLLQILLTTVSKLFAPIRDVAMNDAAPATVLRTQDAS